MSEIDHEAGGGLPVATCSRLSDLLPPAEIVEAAEKVRVWMETNGYQNWQLGGVCDRRLHESSDADYQRVAVERDDARAIAEVLRWRIADLPGLEFAKLPWEPDDK
jgi:hypothetical protein